MNKAELVDKIAADTGLSKAQAQAALQSVTDTIASELAGGGEVAITGFGKFSVSNRAARTGVNPATGEKINIAASKAPKFSAGAALKSTVNN